MGELTDLAQKAHQLGLTLSEYVENLVMNFDKMVEQIKSHEKDENTRLTLVIGELQKKIDFFESEFLKTLLQKYKDQIAEYKNENNEVVKLKLTDTKAVYTLIINSFKIQEDNDHPNTISFG